MAGQLFIMSLKKAEIDKLKKCGVPIIPKIFHANKDNEGAWDRLNQQMESKINDRKGLPPHCYLKIAGGITLPEDVTGVLVELFSRASRPLGIVLNTPTLAKWEDTSKAGAIRIKYLNEALKNGAVMIEFYKVGTSKVLDYFDDDDFTRIDEQD